MKRRAPQWWIDRKARKLAFKEKRAEQHWLKRTIFDIGRFLRRLTLTGLLLASFVLVIGIVIYKAKFEESISATIREGYEIAETIDPSHFEVIPPTVMKDTNGNVIREFKERNYRHLDLQEDDELFQKVSDVTTAIEDARFYNHQGFDYIGVGVAVLDYARGGSLRGASTLTQQLVKNTYLTQEQTMDRKITEAVIAQELENVFTKREILEFYVNDAYYAHGNYGMETAAHYYFSKPTKELTHAQVATLISIPNNPTIYSPLNNPDNTISRRNLVLRLLQEGGVLDEELVKEEQSKDLGLEITKTSNDNTVSGWAESFAMDSTVEELMRYEGFQFKYWFDTEEERTNYKQHYADVYQRHYQNVLRGGYTIETSIDPDKQQLLQRTVDNQTAHFTAIDEDGYYSKQAPSVVIDNRTNEVVAIVGGRTQENMGQFNRASKSAKQPGSSIKPFLSFAPAIESGLATGTMRKDAAIKGGPGNWYDGYRGDMTLRYALTQSVNTIAYNLYQEVGMENARQKLIDMEFSHLSPKDIYPTMAIGGWTYGTNPVEIASAFNTLTNDGMYHRPNNIRKITSRRTDEVIYDRAEHKPKRVYESGAGYATISMMQSVISDGFSGGYSFGYPYEAGKTGSTDGYREQWFVGGSPYYSMALYIGDNNPKDQNSRTTTPVLQGIFTNTMKPLHDGLPIIDYVRPQTVVEQNGNIWIRSKKDVDPQISRKGDEERRIATLQANQTERVDSLAYRIVHGLTLEQTETRERVAADQIKVLEKYSLRGSKDLTEAQRLRDDAQKSVDKVVRDEYKQDLESRLANAYRQVEVERDEIIWAEEEAKRIEQERIEQERLERERQDRLAREEEERIIREEKERIERLEREEEERIERERQQQEDAEREERQRLEQEQFEREEQERLEQEERERQKEEEAIINIPGTELEEPVDDDRDLAA